MLSGACSGIVYRWRQNVITDVLDPLTPRIWLLTHLQLLHNSLQISWTKSVLDKYNNFYLIYFGYSYLLFAG